MNKSVGESFNSDMERTRATSIPNIWNNITPPSDDIPILEYYKGFYDCVYIILHPFAKVIDASKLEFTSESRPTKKDWTENSQKVSWVEFIKLSDLKDLNRLDIALRNSILGLVKEHKNDEDLKLLEQASEENNLIHPGEGNFCDLLIDDMLKALWDLGHDWIYIGDEHGSERKMEFIQDIINNKVPIERWHENWYTTKNEILFTTHWDSHFTMLCSDRKTVKSILEKYPFEGFYCDAYTEVYWSIHSKA